MIRLAVALAAVIAFAHSAAAQEPRVAIGASIDLVTQTRSDDPPLGGTTLGATALVGVRVAPRVSIEVEPSFGGGYAWEYTYRPSPSLVATVTPTRRDTFFPVQARIHTGVLEPVFGAGVVHSTVARHAVVGGMTYFDDGRSDNRLAFVGGVDAAFKIAPHAYVVPTFRVRVGPGGSYSGVDPLGEQTSTGLLNFRYGVGARVGF